jgi:two-component system phosphate regulon sensor histidine kinase PhoR
MNRKYLFILISFIALLAVVLIQVNWIVKSAALKEELFNEKAKIVLSKASEAISKDKVTCKKIGETFESDVAIELSQFEVIDSLFNYYMNFYKIDMDYSYKILAPEPLIIDETKQCFQSRINRR